MTGKEVADGTARPFDGDLDGYRALLDEADRGGERRPSNGGKTDGGRTTRREAAERRLALEPLRRRAREAARAAERLGRELSALDRQLADPGEFAGGGAAFADALKRRAELAGRIAKAEADWLAAEEEIERAAPAS